MIFRFFEKLRVLPELQRHLFGEYFEVIFYVDFSMNFSGHPRIGVEVSKGVLRHLSNRLQVAESRHSSSSYMADGY